MLAFDLDQQLTSGLAGFAIKCTPPSGNPYYIPNRLSFSTPITTKTTPEQRKWTPSSQAPIQKFRWIDFPNDAGSGTFTYEVTPMYFDGNALRAGPVESVQAKFGALQTGNPDIGFTRGYISSQGYAARFNNAPIRPDTKTIDFDTAPYVKQYEWLGYHARQILFNFMQECMADPDVTVDLFAYDLDEPDFVRDLVNLGGKLRAVLDNASLHTQKGAMEIDALALLQQSAGEDHIQVGHFKRFAHDKVLIQKKNGVAVKVLTGSANFSVRGLYVQANNVLVFNNADTAGLYEQAFNEAFTDMKNFSKAAIAQEWFPINISGGAPCSICFSPHKTAEVSLDKVATAIQNAKSSVIYAVMQLGGGGQVLQQLREIGSNNQIFSYGVTQSAGKLNLYQPGQTKAIFADFNYLSSKVPAPFRKEWSGGAGQVIHDKFVAVDFNGENPVVFSGSSNLAEGGEKENGDNLLAITDPAIVIAYAVEGIRLVDHYHFRMVMKTATDVKPLELQGPDAPQPWWQPYYTPDTVKYNDRMLFAG
jgi:hypothetical protein